jgi:hypothetical protein
MEKSKFDDIVDRIALAVLVDSRIVIDKNGMRSALQHDLSYNGDRPLSDEEIDFLVTGEDLDGSSELEKLYKNVCSELEEYF